MRNQIACFKNVWGGMGMNESGKLLLFCSYRKYMAVRGWGWGGGVENPGMDFDDLSFKLKGKKKSCSWLLLCDTFCTLSKLTENFGKL